MKISIKKTLLALALSGLAISPLQAKNDESNVQEVRDEVSIMLNILQASLKQQESKKNVRFRADSVFYLANQGVVFDIGSNRRGGNIFRFNLGGLNGLIDDIPEVPDLSDSNKFEFNMLLDKEGLENGFKGYSDRVYEGDGRVRRAKKIARDLLALQQNMDIQAKCLKKP